MEEISKIPKIKLKFIVVPMEEMDYFDNQTLSHAYKYSVVPYTKLKQLTYKKNQSKILLKFDFNEDFVEKIIQPKPQNEIDVREVQQLMLVCKLSFEKISDIQNMFDIMPEPDQLFYKNIFNSRILETFDATVTIDNVSDSIVVPKITPKHNNPLIKKAKQCRRVSTVACKCNKLLSTASDNT